jgi:hypothetical protein
MDVQEHNKLPDIINNFFNQTGLECPFVAYDKAFHQACEDEALSLGWSPKCIEMVRPFLPGGVIMSITAYNHLTNHSTRIYIALYTAALICLDDTYQNNKQAIMTFNARFVNNAPEYDPALEGLSIILRQTTCHFDCIPSNIIVTATLNFVTGLSLEHDLEKTSVRFSFVSNYSDGVILLLNLVIG